MKPIVLRTYREPGRVTTVELRQWLPVLVALAVLAWHVAAPSEVSAVGLGLLLSLLLSACLWALAMARQVSARRRLHYAAVQVGDELEERLVLVNRSWLPVLWAEFHDRSSLPGYNVTSVRATGGHSELNWRAQALCTRRGLFVLGPWELRLGDPFNLFLVRQVYTQQQELLVYPPLAPLPPHLQPHNSQLGEQRRLRQPIRADTLSAATTRAYAPGDPLRQLHWPTTARRSEPYTKVFDPEATSTIWLVPDFDPRVHGCFEADPPASTTAPPAPNSEELMVLLAASLADHLLRRSLAVGLLAQTDRVHVVRPERGRPHLWTLLRALAPLHAASPFGVGEALARAQAPLSPRDRLVVLTPSLDPTWPRALRTLALRGGVDCLLLTAADPAGAGGAARACVLALAEQGVAAQVVTPDALRPAAGAYGELRRWEFMTLGTGRAVARQRPREWAAAGAAGPAAGGER